MDISKEVLRDFSRRTFLKAATTGTAAGVAATGMQGRAFASASAPLARQEQFLLDRITFGRSPELVAQMRTRGYTGFLNWQLQLPGEDPIDDSQLFDPPDPSAVPPFPGGAAHLENPEAAHAWGLSPYEVLTDGAYPTTPGGLTYAFPGGKMWGHGPQLLTRGAWLGKHQLRWVMTDFLQNVHNTYILQPYQFLFWAPFLKDVIYQNALGSYPALVKASGQGASMLWYLGQPDSDKNNPNENYAREAMELHTIGAQSYVIGQARYETFVESDIAQVAKILTGWDMVGWHILDGGETLTTALGDFRYDPLAHADGVKTVSNTGPLPALGPKDYPGSQGPGQAEGEELLQDLCAHPLCALFLSKRLIQWFIGDDYQARFYEPWVRTAVAFFLSGGDLKATLQELFDQTYFDQICPPGTSFDKVRRPANKVQGLLHALDASFDYAAPGSGDWYYQQVVMGQINGYWAAPNGYQPENEKWIGTLQPVVRFYFDAVWGGTGFTDPSTGQLVDGNGLRIADTTLDAIFPAAAPLGEYAALAAQRLLGGCISGAERDQITQILNQTTLPGDKRRWALFYVLVSPSCQFLC